MTITSNVSADAALIEVAGTIAGADFSQLHRRLVALLQSRKRRIELDFGGVEHVSYRDAAALARDFELVRSHEGELKVTGLRPYVRDILLVAGLHVYLDEHLLRPLAHPGPELALTSHAG